MKDYGRLKNRVLALQTEMPRYDKLKEIQWKKVVRSVGKTGWGLGEFSLQFFLILVFSKFFLTGLANLPNIGT